MLFFSMISERRSFRLFSGFPAGSFYRIKKLRGILFGRMKRNQFENKKILKKGLTFFILSGIIAEQSKNGGKNEIWTVSSAGRAFA